MENSIVVNANAKEPIKAIAFSQTCVPSVDVGQTLLGASASATVVALETQTDELRATIRTTFRLIFCDENGTFFRTEESTDETKTLPCPGVMPLSKCDLTASVTDCETFPGSSARVKATLSVGGWFLQENEIAFADPSQEGLLCKTDRIRVENAVALSDVSVSLSYTEETRMPVVTVLDSCASVTVDNVYPANGSFRAEGETTIRIVALTDNGQIITQTFSHDFSAESAEENLTESMRLDVEGSIGTPEFSVTESDRRLLVCDLSVRLFGVALVETDVERVTDAYSPKRDVEITETHPSVNTHFCLRHGREKAGASETVGGVSEILCVLTPCVTVTGIRNESGVAADGVVSATCLYLDEAGEKKSVRAKIPFSVDLGSAFACGTTFLPEATVSSVSARPRGSSEIEFSAEVSVVVRGVRSEPIRVLSSVALGAEKEEDDYAICLYVVKAGETLWDVAKALNTDEATLQALNRDVSLPLCGGEKILLYRALDE